MPAATEQVKEPSPFVTKRTQFFTDLSFWTKPLTRVPISRLGLSKDRVEQ
jgi:hypothetical protein